LPGDEAAESESPGPQKTGVTGASDVSVDIGLTAYRRATYVREAIDSVLAQTFEGWRLTVCHNGPAGGEIQEAVEPYTSDPRVSYKATGRDLPLAQNWTNALNQGTAPYVAVLNDDDRWHPDYLRSRVKALDLHPECGFAFSEWVQIDADGKVTAVAPTRFAEGVLMREVLAQWFTRQNLVVPPAILVRRSAVETVGAYFDEAWQYCDWELWARLSARFPAYYLARQDNDFRRHADAYTFSERESADHLLAMFDHIEGHFTRELDGFRLSRLTRARNRSQILLHIAGDTHRAGGWRTSRGLYLRALQLYPPIALRYTSLAMLGKSLLGRRGSRFVSRLLRVVRRGEPGRDSAPA